MDPLYNEVFAKFGLDSTSFDKNINYYYGNPKLSAVVYDKIVKNLENEESLCSGRFLEECALYG